MGLVPMRPPVDHKWCVISYGCVRTSHPCLFTPRVARWMLPR